MRRILDATKPRVETADEFLGGDPNAPPLHVAQTVSSPLRTGQWLRITLVLAAAAVVAIGIWLVTQRPFEPAPRLGSDELIQFSSAQGLQCAPPARTEVGVHWTCQAGGADVRTLEWFGASNNRATVLQARGDAKWMGDIAALAVPQSRQDESRQWVMEHAAGGGRITYSAVDLSLDRDRASGGTTLTVDIH